MEISHLDHLVITVSDIPTTINFYQNVLGMSVVEFGAGRFALAFGQQKINLHQHGQEFEPKAESVQVGSSDLCFITKTRLMDVVSHIEQQGVEIIEGPIERTGAMGKIVSIYIRDPDGNLIELSNYLHHDKDSPDCNNEPSK
ncbi:VOC family protein [Vibrio scophthalmi]|uniref:VOC family protein n=1 Tax=Vibrio scophthalmi TaxID=45658 RepID=UPI002283C3B9|nr:VOC family protein [Vibrio scophthalmi]MCY9802453.1 VOC family protein [Vibrio scophthalmi]